MRKRKGSVVRLPVAVVIFGFVVSGSGCISSRVSDLSAYQQIPMNRVVPYPSRDELRKRAFEIIVVDRPSVGIDDTTLEIPRAQVRRRLENFAVEAGGVVIDRSLRDPSAIRTGGFRSEFAGRASDVATGADYALATRFSTYRVSSRWNEPFKFIWQTSEDVATKPGTCHHTVEVEFDVQIIQIGTNERVEKTYVLEHTVEQKNRDLDPACTLSPITLSVLFETAIDEALSCLRLPLSRFLSPRGHITSHRKAPAAGRHIYRVSLGSAQGIAHGDTVEILRVQRVMSPSGEESRSERVITLGRVTDQVEKQTSWVVIDPSKATAEIFQGDVVRPIEDESLLSSLSGPNCGTILHVR